MGFVGNYAPCGLSPQMYNMPVIQKGDRHPRRASVSFLFVRSRVNYANTTNNDLLAFELRKRTLELQRLMAELVMLRLLQKSTVLQSCLQDCLDFAERMKRKALRVRSEGSIPLYVTEAESRKQHSDSPLCNSLMLMWSRVGADLRVRPQGIVRSDEDGRTHRSAPTAGYS